MMDKRQESCHTQQGGRGGSKREPASLESGGHHTGGGNWKTVFVVLPFQRRTPTPVAS